MQKQFEDALNNRAWEYGIISTSSLSYSEELRKSCEQNSCGHYNRCWTCPPAAGTIAKLKEEIDRYNRDFIFTTKYDLEDSFDYEGMVAAKEIHSRLTREMHDKFGRTNPVYGAGSCTICEKCAYPEACRFPEKTYLPVEAAGINVTSLSRTAKVKYNNGENTVTYFSMILFNE
jgi:predicted metal-binding protein